MAYPLDSGTCRDCSVEGQGGGRDSRWLGLCRGVGDWAAGCLAFAQIQKTGLFVWWASRGPGWLLPLPGHSLWLHVASQLLGFWGLTGLGQRQLAEGWWRGVGWERGGNGLAPSHAVWLAAGSCHVGWPHCIVHTVVSAALPGCYCCRSCRGHRGPAREAVRKAANQRGTVVLVSAGCREAQKHRWWSGE